MAPLLDGWVGVAAQTADWSSIDYYCVSLLVVSSLRDTIRGNIDQELHQVG